MGKELYFRSDFQFGIDEYCIEMLAQQTLAFHPEEILLLRDIIQEYRQLGNSCYHFIFYEEKDISDATCIKSLLGFGGN